MFRIGGIRLLVAGAWLLAPVGSTHSAHNAAAPSVAVKTVRADEAALDAARERIDRLKAKGIPTGEVAEARVFLNEAYRALESNNTARAKKAADSMKVYLSKAEEYYRREAPALGPKIEAAKTAALEAGAELTDYQARKVDSIVGRIDYLQRMGRLFAADAAGQKLAAMLPSLKEDEAKAARVKKLIPGEWVYTDKDNSAECPGVNAVISKIFKFGADGKVHLVEKKSGRSGCYLKEDWHFESWGTYGCKGDTIMLSISRFAAVKMMFERLYIIDRKQVWKAEPGPTYDSTVTDGSQDRYITYEDLKEDFKKKIR